MANRDLTNFTDTELFAELDRRGAAMWAYTYADFIDGFDPVEDAEIIPTVEEWRLGVEWWSNRDLYLYDELDDSVREAMKTLRSK